jgi:predicted GNAT family N-acyltransferase
MELILPEGYRIEDPFIAGMEKAYFDLRWRVLRQPWDQPRGTEQDEQEAVAVHRMILTPDKQVVACGRMQLNTTREAQIRYMAVDQAFRGRKLGVMIIRELEEVAVNAGAETMILQARENALSFYQACNYEVVVKTFLLYDSIQHYLMSKRLV